MSKVPNAIKKLKKLSILSEYANISYNNGKPYVYDEESGIGPVTLTSYAKVEESLDKRIAILESRDDK